MIRIKDKNKDKEKRKYSNWSLKITWKLNWMGEQFFLVSMWIFDFDNKNQARSGDKSWMELTKSRWKNSAPENYELFDRRADDLPGVNLRQKVFVPPPFFSGGGVI